MDLSMKEIGDISMPGSFAIERMGVFAVGAEFSR
jgi:hypothetical protein